ncbi:MAG: HAD hydrolase-like protein [Dictyoglomaceae bacterium]|nr:HAD hydrolase-like protein [Dictyoglomaceae bacterium]
MVKSIWFDLDGTLLYNDIETFSKEYFKLLSQKISYLEREESFLEKLQRAIYKMMQNRGPKTNEQVFWDSLLPITNLKKEVLYEFFNSFYKEDFPRLKIFTRPHPYARKVIELAFNLGLKVVIATNAVFPLIAIKERLSWAGIDDFPYFLITSMEIMHSCKPFLEYYKEILEIVDEEPENCIMVGNDIEEDMVARKILVNTYLVNGKFSRSDLINKEFPDFIGPLEELITLLPLLSKK